jgi:hypothetical protein
VDLVAGGVAIVLRDDPEQPERTGVLADQTRRHQVHFGARAAPAGREHEDEWAVASQVGRTHGRAVEKLGGEGRRVERPTRRLAEDSSLRYWAREVARAAGGPAAAAVAAGEKERCVQEREGSGAGRCPHTFVRDVEVQPVVAVDVLVLAAGARAGMERRIVQLTRVAAHDGYRRPVRPVEVDHAETKATGLLCRARSQTPEQSPESRVVVVPLSVGPVIDPDEAERARTTDEIDEALDELFGPDLAVSPSPFDAVLVLGGIGLVLWSVVSLESTFVAVLGVSAVALGLVLPLRSVFRRAKARRAGRRRRELSSRGIVLDASHPLTRDLVLAYEELLAVAELPDTPLAGDAASAAHLALTESAELVGERGPTTAAETEYLERRTRAIRELARELERNRREEATAVAEQRDADARLEREARMLAGEELDATGLTSLRELDELKRALEARRGD